MTKEKPIRVFIIIKSHGMLGKATSATRWSIGSILACTILAVAATLSYRQTTQVDKRRFGGDN